MSNLFSHAHEPDYVAPQEPEEFEESVILGVPANEAFDGFTDGIHLWWPVAEQSVAGEDSHIAILRDHLVEEADDGEEIIWADVAEWESPEFLRLHWILGQAQHGTSEVDIHFEDVGEGRTRVRILAVRPIPSADGADDDFVCDWSLILSRYARYMGGALKLD